ncbi:transmembrane protein 68-like [Belonocnema kinseyi]|uniref:transmembrane protein 68-like n=1 Tax=Belonocnema kinseyi TaxID=2817044 RepID=UPI00143DD894|nr:transmembrane protein 68-like [Belonocnema kinseyi]
MFSIPDFWTSIENFVDYLDLDFTPWIPWLLPPVIIIVFFPYLFLIFTYFTSLIIFFYKMYRKILGQPYDDVAKETIVKVVAAIWATYGWIWHGYDVVGLENIPVDQPILFVYYHGAIPMDIYYFMAWMGLIHTKLIHTVVDRFVFKVPGWSPIIEAFKGTSGTVESCSSLLKEGHMLAIAPGGTYESQFGDSRYKLMWKKRLGFAKVALNAKVCIIPVFTRNIREAFRTLSWGRRWWFTLYEATKLPFNPVYGGFPVKLKTFVGKPIPYDGSLTPEQLRVKVAGALEELIQKHQKMPGSIMRALWERVYDPEDSS